MQRFLSGSPILPSGTGPQNGSCRPETDSSGIGIRPFCYPNVPLTTRHDATASEAQSTQPIGVLSNAFVVLAYLKECARLPMLYLQRRLRQETYRC